MRAKRKSLGAALLAAVALSGGAHGVRASATGSSVAAAAGLRLAVVASQDDVAPKGIAVFEILVADDGAQPFPSVRVQVGPLPGGAQATPEEWQAALAPRSGQVWSVRVTAPGAGGPAALVLPVRVRAGASLVLSATSRPVAVGPVEHDPFFKGYPDGRFLPQRAISRAEVAAVVARIERLVPLAQPGAPRFRDVPPSAWEFPYVQAVSQAHLMDGYPDGTFRPQQPITRAELAAVLVRMAVGGPIRFAATSPLQPIAFRDAAQAPWAEADMATAQVLGLMGGLPGGVFGPNADTARAQAAKALDRFLGRGPLVNGKAAVVQHFPDVPRSAWYFGWVEQAAKVGHLDLAEPNGADALVRYLLQVTTP